MNDRDAQDEGLLALMDELLNGVITPERMTALERALDGSAAAQKLFFDYCQVHVDLDYDARTQRVLDAFCQRERTVETAQKQAASQPPAEQPAKPVANPGVIGLFSQQIGQYLPNSMTFGSPAFVVATLLSATVLLATVLLAIFIAIPAYVAIPVAQRLRDPQPLAEEEPTRDGRPAEVLARAPALTSVKIASGATTLALDNIGSVIVEGPADFELIGPARARLNKGRIKVHITEKGGQGFVVETPNGEVTDLGTEFGLDVSSDRQTGLVVFQGAVDLRVPETGRRGADTRVERLVEGEGVVVNGNQLGRIMSIVTGDAATFQQCSDTPGGGALPVITDVTDNLRSGDTKKFYEIVPRGLRDGSRAYVDRPQFDWRWVRLDDDGMPPYLVGADYVKPFNNDKMRRDTQIEVTISRPARLYLIFDDRVPTPEWLTSSFRDTGDDVGIDLGPGARPDIVSSASQSRTHGKGNGVYTRLSVWERVLDEPGKVRLGPNSAGTALSAMYGIAAVALEPEEIGHD